MAARPARPSVEHGHGGRRALSEHRDHGGVQPASRPTTELAAAGVDSMALLKVLVFLEREFGLWVPDEDLTDDVITSARTLAAYVCRRTAVTTTPPRSVALLGPDVVLLAMETLGAGTAASSNAVLVVELADALDPSPGRVGPGALPRHLPVARRASLRPWPWGKLRWRCPRADRRSPPVRRHAVAAGGLGALVDRELCAPIDPYREPRCA